MDSFYFNFCAIIFFLAGETFITSKAAEIPFNQNYVPTWGGNHISILEQGRQVQILIDQYSGGGFKSRKAFGSGLFRMSVKIPKNSKGIATTFYLTSEGANGRLSGGNHDELDFELLGHDGPSYTLNTNVFAQDSGNREQQFKLWFDPTLNFHDYELLWNQNIIVFFVDKVPIRIFKNHKKIGARYPMLPMNIVASLWNGTGWLGPVDWNKGPFFANYRGFDIKGCTPKNPNSPTECSSKMYEWNAPKNWQLTPQQRRSYQNVRNKYMIYDYCKSKSAKNFPECRIVD